MASREHSDFLQKVEEHFLKMKQIGERILKLELELQQKELHKSSHLYLALMQVMQRKHNKRLNDMKRELREKTTSLELTLQSTFKQAVEVEVESRLRQIKELTNVRGNANIFEIQDRVARHPNYESVLNNMKRMEIELRCGICSELMVSATTLNCMHTFCQYCISQWKHFDGQRETVARCPVCRDVTMSEKRNYFADNLIEIMVDSYPEEEKNSRKELVAHHQEKAQQNVEMPSETNLAIQSTNRISQFMGEIEKKIEAIFKFLAEPNYVILLPPVQPTPPPPPPPVVPPSQATVSISSPARLRLEVAAVIPIRRRSAGSRTSATGRNPSNQQIVRGGAQSDRQTRPAIFGIQGPRTIQRTTANRTNQSSARSATGRTVQGSLARPVWRPRL